MKALKQHKWCLLFLKKQFLTVAFISFISTVMWSQSITELEYFFGSDPGFGNGTTLSVNTNTGDLTQAYTLPVTGFEEGFQQLSIRALDSDGTWGLYQRVIFYVFELASDVSLISNIAAAEYWFDTDPGFGNGTALTISGTPSEATESFVIPLGSLEPGFHSLGLRTQNTDGTWSLYDKKVFYIFELASEEGLISNIAGAEYWFDTDPGFGNGTALTISGTPSEATESFVIPLGSLEPGFHSLGLRTQNTDGTWSLYDKKVFYVFDSEEFDVSPLTEIEFLFDEELGYGTGQTAPIIATGNPDEYLVEIPTDLVSCDIHDIWISVKNEAGKYSLYNILVDVDVFDNENPTIVVFPDITVALDTNGEGSLTIADVDGGTFDDCELISVELNQTKFNYTCDNLGANTVTVTAIDAEAKVSTQDVTVTVVDNINPVAIAQNLTVALDENGIATITGNDLDNGSTDNCSIVNRSVNISNFTCDNLGENTITFTVEDAGGNTNSVDAIITVIDDLNPIASAQDISIQLDENGLASLTVNDVDTSTDNCAIATSTIDITTFDCSNLGANTVTLMATDTSGNSSSTTATVTVEDQINPVAVVQNLTVQLDENGLATITADDLENGSTDNCGIDNRSIDISSFTCDDLGANTVSFTVEDTSGNTSSVDVTVTIEDISNPVAVAQNITVQLDANGLATITANDLENGSTDNCGIANQSIDISSFSCDNLGENTVIYTVEDSGGNSNNTSAIVTVIDTISPNVITQNLTVLLDANGLVSVTVDNIDNNSSDNCGIASRSLDLTTFDCSNLGDNIVTLSVTDNSGNTGSSTALITVIDTVNPLAIAQNITVQLDSNGLATITSNDLDNGSTDNCGISNRSVDITSFNCDNLGANTVIFTVEDTSGNTNSTAAIVTVEDNLDPVAIGQDITVDLEGNPSVTITAEDVNNGSSDNCGSITLSIDVDTFTVLGEFPVVLSVEDAVGNLVTVTVTVTVIDSSLSITDNTVDNNGLIIHPNPTKNVLYFETKSTISSFNIIDVTGKIVLKQQNPNNEIKVEQLSHGVYFIRFITDGGQSIIKRFVKN